MSTKIDQNFNSKEVFDDLVQEVAKLAWRLVLERDDVIGSTAFPGVTAAVKAYASGAMCPKLGRLAMEQVTPEDAFSIVVAEGWQHELPWGFLMADMRRRTCYEASPVESCIGVVVTHALREVLGDFSDAYCAEN